MPLTNESVDAAIPVAGTPSRTLTNAALKQLILDVVASLARSSHTGTQASTTIADFGDAVDDRISAFLITGLNALPDVVVTAPVVGDQLRHNGVSFVNVKAGDLVRIASGTTDALSAADDGRVVVYTNAAAIEVDVPEAATNIRCWIQWLGGTGTITLNPSGAVQLNGSTSSLVLSQASGMVELTPTGTNLWNVVGATGDLVAADITDSGATGRALVQAASASAARGTISAAAQTQAFGINATFPTGADDNIVLDQYAAFPYTIDATYSQCDSGTATYRLQINGVNVGTTANSVSSSEQSQAHAADNVVAVGDTVRLVRSANAACVMGRLKMNCTRVLS